MIESAEKRIVLIDNYIDASILTLFLKRKNNVEATVYTMQMSTAFKLDLQKHNKQYSPVAVKIYTKALTATIGFLLLMVLRMRTTLASVHA